MITRDINEVTRELYNMVIEAIYDILSKKGESTIDLSFMYQNTLYEYMEVFITDDGDYIDVEIASQYIDNEDGLVYEDTNDIRDLDLSVLLKIYNMIKE